MYLNYGIRKFISSFLLLLQIEILLSSLVIDNKLLDAITPPSSHNFSINYDQSAFITTAYREEVYPKEAYNFYELKNTADLNLCIRQLGNTGVCAEIIPIKHLFRSPPGIRAVSC